jgi:hypothetical protein
VKPSPQLPSIWESIKEQFEEPLIKALLILGIVALLTGFNDGLAWGWVKGVSIFISVGFLVSIAAGTDYVKDKQFLALKNELADEEVICFRGKSGAT